MAILVMALLAVAAPVAAQEPSDPLVEPTPIDFGSRIVVPAAGVGASNEGGVFFVQFAEPLAAAQREALGQQGAFVAQPIPPTTYVVRMAAGSAAAVAAVDGFLGLAPMIKIDKETDSLGDGSVPPHAIDDAGIIAAQTEFFGNVSLAEALAVTDAAGVEVGDRSIFLVGNRLDVSGTQSQLDALILDDAVLFVTETTAPPMVDNATAQAVANADDVQALGRDGNGVILGIWDGEPVLNTHGDLGTGRVILNELAQPTSDHATHVSGTMIGSGAGNAAAEGMAPGVGALQSYDFFGDTATEMTTAVNTQSIVATNHSWGFTAGRSNGTWYGEGAFGRYDAQARAWDLMVQATDLITVKSSGNDRNDCGFVAADPTPSCDGFLGGDGEYYDNISLMGNAKNIITVGAIEDDGTTITSFSSAGPADDGRIKPDVVANGAALTSTCSDGGYCSKSGTSMASPTVTGVVALLEQDYRAKNGGANLPADLAKAVLVNTAEDLGRVGPDYLYGYGNVDALAAIGQLGPDSHDGGSLSNGGSWTETISVTAGSPLRTSLVWVDPAAAASTADDDTVPDLINNLDITLTAPGGAVSYPFSGPGRNDVTGLATATGPNMIDNVEQVLVANPVAGNWTVTVSGTNVASGPQSFAVVTSASFGAPACGNDHYADAIDLGTVGTTAVTATGSTSCATGETGETSDGVVESVWYEFTSAQTGSMTVSTCPTGTNYDTYLGVFTNGANVGSASLLKGDDDPTGAAEDRCAATSLRAQVTLPVSGGTTYKVQVDGHGSAEGDFALSLRQNWCGPFAATQVGSSGADFFDLVPNNATVVALEGADQVTTAFGAAVVLCGNEGNDTLTGSSSGDIIVGGPGGDDIRGQGGGDLLLGDTGNFGDPSAELASDGGDTIRGGGGGDAIYGQGGVDNIIAGDGADAVDGGSGADSLNGGAGPDEVHGGPGADAVRGQGDVDTQWGDDGNDIMRGHAGNDIMRGGNGEDTLLASTGDDTLYGGPNDDTLWAGSGADFLNGGSGSGDFCHGGSDTDTDTHTQCEILRKLP